MTIKKPVLVTTTEETEKDLNLKLAEHKNNVNPDSLIGQPFLNRSALCHAIFKKFGESPEETLKFLNLNK